MPEIFVPPDWVETFDGDLSLVDVRRKGEYGTDHIPGAVHVPFEAFRDPSDDMAGKLPTPSDFAALLTETGVGPDDRIVAYDDDFGVYASRFLVTAEVFGHDRDRLHVLDGDIETWARTYETTAAVPEPPVTDYTCRRRSGGPLVGAEELEASLDGDAVIVDTRDPLEYETVHLPDAVNLQWRDLVADVPRQLKPRDEVAAILEDHGISPERPVRLYCNTARRLSFVYAVLRELGYDDVAFYEGGIDTWAEYGGQVETSTTS